jgi:hypothetical protein
VDGRLFRRARAIERELRRVQRRNRRRARSPEPPERLLVSVGSGEGRLGVTAPSRKEKPTAAWRS